jgi:Arc/MetJ-type ribon-helix-helix transcriptional regulator
MAATSPTATLEAEIPARVLDGLKSLVEAGWFRNLDDVIVDALRRYLESHRSELLDELILEDVEWGLRGTD